MKKRKKFELNDILGGQILTKSGIISQWGFVLYIFFLITIYISINMGVERTQIIHTKNKQELTNLKADYTSKTAKLQYISKRGEINSRLEKLGSKVKDPTVPATFINIDNSNSNYNE
jgi:hypothetical protein